ncbi:S-layer homology domain-containing protein [Paenibacillus ginsengarvi]|uniref:SLH domain-containing protein n=1 Tax=Paenibacillus ginsengarvi TaxID=400777 RepID=A0A3B0CMX1_9BACL|nr:S-layer homology domain-containing protein [Paenibacillus ginsengarvi]RKN86221.1 hypothetical protein D7M11_04210 [Paenibacillus ginsengarvi]
MNGAIPGWTVDATTATYGSIELSSTQARSGASSLLFQDKVSGTSPNGAFRMLSNSIKASAGDTVTFDVYVYKVAAADQSHGIQPVIHYYTAAGAEITPNAFVNYGNTAVPIGSWHKLTVSAKAPANTAYVKVGLYSGFPSLTKVYVDDANITVVPFTTPPQEQGPAASIVNPGFEAALDNSNIPGWSIAAGTSGEIGLDSNIVRSGLKSLHFKDTSTTAGLRVISSGVSVTPGASVMLKSNVYVINQTHNIVPEIRFYNTAGDPISVKQELFGSVTLGTNKWTEMRISSTVPAGTAYAKAALYSGDPSLTEAYFDDISLDVIPPEEPLNREYEAPVNLGPMVNVNLGQSGAIQTNAKGENEVYFVTNGLPGTFYALDAETGALKFKQDIPKTEATWAMTVGSDKNVYFAATGDGNLYRYVPAEKKVEALGYNTADNWVWDIEEIDGKIYGGTYNPDTHGKLFEYDIATKQFRNYGTVKSGQQYVRGIAVDEQYIYAGLGTTVQLFKVDRVTGEKTEIVIPGHTGVTNTIADVFKVKNKLFVSVSTVNMVVWDLETNTIDASFTYSNMISEPNPGNTDEIYYKDVSKLYKYNISTKKSTEIPLTVPLPDTTRVKDMTWIQLKSGEKAGKTVLAMVTQYGEYMLYDPTDHWLSFVELAIEPQPVRIQGIERGFDGRLYFGGYQRGMSIYNPFTNKIDVNVSSFAQPEGIGFMNNKVYYGTYVSAIMYSYDPAEPVLLNKNPKYEYKVSHQDRPFAITSGDNKLFVGTVPDYGFLGGALAIYDEATDTWKQYNHEQVVKNQSIIGLAYKDGLLYGGTTVWGGLGIEPSEPQAKIFVWDVANERKIDEITLNIPGIDEAPRMIGELSFGPDGLLWGAVDGTIFAMDVQTKQIVKSKMIQPSTYSTSKWMPFHLRWAPDGMLYTTLSRKIIAVDPETLKYKIIVNDFLNSMTIGIDGSIFYAPDAGVSLSRIAVPETDATLAAITVNGTVLEGFSPGVLEYTAAIPANANIQAMATEALATISKETIQDSKQTIIRVTAKDGKSKLEYKINHRSTPTPTPLEQAIEKAKAAIADLPAVITLADKPSVVAARAAVAEAISKGALDTDITNLSVLITAEAAIAQLEKSPENPSPGTGGNGSGGGDNGSTTPGTGNGGDNGSTTPGADHGGDNGSTTPGAGNDGENGSTTPPAGNSGNNGSITPPAGTGSGNAIQEQKHIVGSNELQKAAVNGKVEVAIPPNANQIALPAAQALEALGQNQLAIVTDQFKLNIPPDLLKQLVGNLSKETLENGMIELKMDVLPQSESEKLIGLLQSSEQASIKLFGAVIDFGLSFVGKNGEKTGLSEFSEPITLHLNVDSAANPNLAGVYFIADDSSLTYIGGDIRGGVLSVSLHHFSKYAVLEYKKSYADVSASHWAIDVIEGLTAKHVISGTSSSTFEPDRAITRAEFTSLLVKAMKLTNPPGPHTFADVAKGSWYEQPISIAVQTGIANGKSDTVFDPNGSITRQEMVAMMMRAYAIQKGVKLDGSLASAFSDESAVAPWAVEYVRAAASFQLIQGREAGAFVPQGISTRAEAAAIIQRILQKQ